MDLAELPYLEAGLGTEPSPPEAAQGDSVELPASRGMLGRPFMEKSDSSESTWYTLIWLLPSQSNVPRVLCWPREFSCL